MKKKIEITANCCNLRCYPGIDSESEPYELEDWIMEDEKYAERGECQEWGVEVTPFPGDEDYLYHPYYYDTFFAPTEILSVKVDGKDITDERGEDAERFWVKDQFAHIPHEELPDCAGMLILPIILLDDDDEEYTHKERTLTGEIELEDGEEFDPKQLQLVKMPRMKEDSPETWEGIAFDKYDTGSFYDYCPTWALYKGQRIPLKGSECYAQYDDENYYDESYHYIGIEELFNIEED